MAPLASTAATFNFSSMSPAAVKYPARSLSALAGRVVDGTLVDETLVRVDPTPFVLLVGVLAHEAPINSNNTAAATTVLRTTRLLLVASPALTAMAHCR
jgi:hypothetical protein